jgi:site-specific DNA recombinase
MKAFLIARVSTVDQVDALPAQIYRLTDYAKIKGYDFELFQFHESAYKGTREKFREVIGNIRTSTEKIIVVFDKVDRFSRDSSAEETGILKKLYLTGKIELHFPSENLYLHEHSPSTDKMRLGLNTIFAEYYSDAISDNVRRRNQQLWRDGIWTGAAPFGYKNVTNSDGKKWIEVEPLKAAAVHEAYKAYATGSYSLATMRKKIIQEFGFTLTTAQWDKILKNPFYTGIMRIKGELFPHHYETIVSEKEFEAAKRVREGYHIKPKIWGGLPYPYRGLISCAECGCRITFEKKKQKYVYGHCTQHRGKHNATYVNQNDLTQQLRSVFMQIQLPEDAYDEVTQALQQDEELSGKQNQKRQEEITAELKRLETKIERNYEAYLDGMIAAETYQRKNRALLENKRILETTRNNFELIAKDTYSDILNLLDVSRRAPEIFENAENEEKRTLINMTLSNLELFDKELRWKLKKPYDTMAFCNETQNWLGRRDSNPRMPGPKPGALPLGHALSSKLFKLASTSGDYTKNRALWLLIIRGCRQAEVFFECQNVFIMHFSCKFGADVPDVPWLEGVPRDRCFTLRIADDKSVEISICS